MRLLTHILAIAAAAHAHHHRHWLAEPHATAYSPCSSPSARTADGTKVRFGVLASNRLRMGTLLRFRHPIDGRTLFAVHDTGGAAMRLDVFMPDCGEAVRFGVREVAYRIVKRRGR